MNTASSAAYYLREFQKIFVKSVIERIYSNQYSGSAGGVCRAGVLEFQQGHASLNSRSLDRNRGEKIRSCGKLKTVAPAIETSASFTEVLRRKTHLRIARSLLHGATGGVQQVVKAVFGKAHPDKMPA